MLPGWWDENGYAFLSSASAESSQPSLSSRNCQRAVSHFSCVPGSCQVPAFTLPVSELFYLMSTTGFQKQILGTLPKQTVLILWGMVSPGFGLCQPVTREWLHVSQWFRVYGKVEQRVGPQVCYKLAVLSLRSYSYAWEQCSTLVPPILPVTQGILRSCPLLGPFHFPM